MDKNRKLILKELIEFSMPIKELSNKLSFLDWDYTGVPITLKLKDVEVIILRYINKEINEYELEYWADLIELRDDIEYESENECITKDIIYKLANPVLEGEINLDLCNNLINEINKKLNK